MFKKIKEFFRKLFGKNQKYIEAPKEEIKVNDVILNKADFKKEIEFDNKENFRILKLQKDFKEGIIKEEDLSEKDYNSLVELYESQIEKTRQSIENYKNKILEIKSKLVQSN